MFGTLKKDDSKKKHETAEEVLERAANTFFNQAEVQKILKSSPETNKILINALERQKRDA